MYRSILFVRFSLSDRIGHWVYALIVLLLIVTGFSQMFPMNPLTLWIFNIFNGIENVRLVHHYSGFLFFVHNLYLTSSMSYSAFIRKIPITIAPTFEYVMGVLLAYRYNLNILDVKPPLGRVVLTKQSILWALIWGSIMIVLTGFILLNPVAVTTILPGIVVPMAKIAHGFEAVLVVIVLIIWHSYFFLMKYLDRMITRLHPEIKTRYIIDHPIELVDMYDGRIVTKVDVKTIETYWRYHLPVYLLACGALLLGAFYFVNFETTSIQTTIDPESVRIYAPGEEIQGAEPGHGDSLPPPDMPQQPLSIDTVHSWKSCISNLLLINCVNCHETENISGIDLRDYSAIINSGLVKPGLPSESRLLLELSDERHTDRYSTRLLNILYDWITSGAPEVNITPELEELYVNLTWDADIRQIMSSNCIECHGSEAPHDIDFRSYYSTMDSGSIELGSPDESTILIKIGAGGHPDQFSPDELLKLHEWINNGAPSGMTSVEAALEYREIAFTGFIPGRDEVTPIEEEPEISPVEEHSVTIMTWEDGISGIFSANCTTCHGSNAMGGLDLTSYEAVMMSDSIIPYDPDSSSLILLMRSGSHPALLSTEDLDSVVGWISDGALETAIPTVREDVDVEGSGLVVPEGETPGMVELWDESISQIFSGNCTTCHGTNAIGGVDLTSYDSTMASGMIILGDPAGSPLVKLMESGNHPALLSEDDLAAVRDWISTGE